VDSENAGYFIRKQLGRRAKGTDKGAHYRDTQDYEELLSWEKERQRSLKNQFLLQRHRITHGHADNNSQDTTRKHKNKCFIEVKHPNPALRKPDCSQDADLLGLLVDVCRHVGTQSEQAQEHGDCNDDVEDLVQKSDYLVQRV